MRISTATLFDSGTNAILDRQASLAVTQQQVATGRRILQPSDDPSAAAEVVSLSSVDARVAQYQKNVQIARARLGLSESTLGSVGNLLQRARELALSAGNGTFDDSARKAVASELRVQLASLLGLANTADPSTGGYLFSGSASNVAPYSAAGGVHTYAGNEGRLAVPVSDTVDLRSTVNGVDLFERVRTGNGNFATGAAAANAGSALIDGGRVVAPAGLTGDRYAIRFTVVGTTTTYAVVDTTTSATLASGQPYVSGRAIAFDGIEVAVSGAPANGDEFTVAPSVPQNVFDTLERLAALLEQPTIVAGDRMRVHQGIQAAIDHLDRAHDRVLVVRAELGARLRQADDIESANADHALALQSRMSSAQDLDYAKGVSDLTRQQLALEAAQRSFAKITQRTLFDYL